jgi:hypothetical protein
VPRQGSGGTVTRLDRDGASAGTRPIAGLKAGWEFRVADRMILHRAKQDAPSLPIGTVPVVLGRVTFRMSDGRHTKIGYMLQTDEGPRIAAAEKILDGSWADVCGRDRPVGADEKHAYARILSEDVREAPELAAIPVKTKDGSLILPGADAQELGYLRIGDPDEAAALAAWRAIFAQAVGTDRTTLALGAAFSGPLISSLQGVQAHILNLQGTGQLGKSTAQKVMASMLGDPTDGYELFGSMNSTGLALPEALIQARYLPMFREETSSAAMSFTDLERVFSRIVAGGKRSRLGQGGQLQASIGSWHSIFVTSSNESLLRPGQVESLASRLIQLHPPFFNGAEGSITAEATSLQFHGWPLVWAERGAMFQADAINEARRLHGEIVQRLTVAEGGIPLTLSRILAAWCVGAYMLGELLGMPEIGPRAEEDARVELPRILGEVMEVHLTPGQVLWDAIAGAIAQEPAAWASASDLVVAKWEFAPRRVLGYHYQGRVHVYVATVKDLTKHHGLDSAIPGLKELKKRGVLITQETTKLASKHPTVELRERVPGRAYIFDPKAAQDAFADREDPADPTPEVVPAPADDSASVAAEQRAFAALAAGPPVQVSAAGVVEPRRSDVTEAAPAASVLAFPPARMRDAGDPAVSGTWLRLEHRAHGRTHTAMQFGVLGTDGLHLPNHHVVPVDLPASVDEVPALMTAYGLKTLWLHESAGLKLGLPTYQDRTASLSRYKGPQGPTPHPWATPAADSGLEVQGDGLSCWMTLKTDGQRLSLALPMYEDRFDRADEEGRGGFGGCATPEILLDSLMVYLLSTQHGTEKTPKLFPYYMSPNATAQDFAGGKARTDVTSEAIRNRAVPPVHIMPPLVDMQWSRAPEDISLAERAALWLHQYDKNAAWLAAFGAAKLGIGEPEHHQDGTEYDASLAGYWRVREIPGTGLPGLPQFKVLAADEGGFWLRTPGIDLLREVYPDWQPDVVEAWVWPQTKRALIGMYEHLRVARERVILAGEQGHPGARYAKHVIGALYQSFRGYLARVGGPQADHAGGGAYAKDIYWRPDWAAMILDLALANTYRNLAKFAAEGRFPLSLKVDAVIFSSDEADPEKAAPATMKLGTSGGQWKPERIAPLAEVLPAIDEGQAVSKALRLYLTKGE